MRIRNALLKLLPILSLCLLQATDLSAAARVIGVDTIKIDIQDKKRDIVDYSVSSKKSAADTLKYVVKAEGSDREPIDFMMNRPAADTISFGRADSRRRLLSFAPASRPATDTLAFTPSGEAASREELIGMLAATRESFRSDWVVYLRGACNTFQGDRSSMGKFSGTLSAQLSAGVGWWINPWFGIFAEYTRSESRGYTTHITDYGFGYGPLLTSADGTVYRAMKTKWWNVSGYLTVNLTRVFTGYEGYRSDRNLNIFTLSGGVGALRHLAFRQIYGNGWQLSGMLQLGYTRFFTRARRVSLDVAFRWMMCHTNFDYESRRSDRRIYLIDSNLALSAGVSFYLGRMGKNNPYRIIDTYKTDY